MIKSSYDLIPKPFWETSVGFDNLLAKMFNDSFGETPKYPPYNIKKISDNHFLIEVAVAGFKQEEISVELSDGVLLIAGTTGNREPQSANQYIHQGISARSFVRKFSLSDDIEILGADLTEGILQVSLVKKEPPKKDVVRIPVTGGRQ